MDILLILTNDDKLTNVLIYAVDIPNVVTVCVVGGVGVVEVVLERPGFHISKRQNVGSVIGADSGPVFVEARVQYTSTSKLIHYIPQNSVPLENPSSIVI